jgi:hypothetical protein
MAKYLIQDIIPNDRPRPTRRVYKPEHKEIASNPIPDGVRALHHDQGKTVRLRSRMDRPTDAVHTPTSETHSEAVRAHKNPRTIISDTLDSESGADFPLVEGVKYFDETMPDDSSLIRKRNIPPTERSSNGGAFWRNWTPWFAGFVFCGVVGVLGMNYLGGATIVVSPKKESIPMNIKIGALKKPIADELPFSVMKIALDETKEVPATGEKTVTAKAKGSIIIYNTQSVSQRLIKNTRFQSTSGKIYRISDSINVPKSTVKSGKTVPGSLEVVVYADEAGPDYNSAATDFTLPGLKGSATFDKVYARGKGAIAGGASGTIKSVSDLDLKNASDELRVQLETKLRTKARGDLSPSQLSFDKGIIVELKEAGLSKLPASSADKAVVMQAGTLYMVTFDREVFTKILIEKLVQAYKGETVSISNIDSIEFDMQNMTGQQLWDLDKLDFSLKGMPNLEWSIDESAIKKALMGMPKESFNTIMAQFPTIELAKATISPIWKRSFPKENTKIEIQIESVKSEK